MVNGERRAICGKWPMGGLATKSYERASVREWRGNPKSVCF